MRLSILIIVLLVFVSNLFSQDSIDSVLIQVEKNNTTLLSARKNSEAEKIGNKMGIFLQNPEAEFNYLWGNPSAIGNRTDFSIKQSFDFPTAYGYKNQISNLKNEQADLEYLKQLKTILLETRLVCYDLIYINALKSELAKRHAHAQGIEKSYKLKFEAGETNILEYNKAGLNRLTIGRELEAAEIGRKVLLSELTRLNGGQPIEFTDSVYPMATIPADFEEWFLAAGETNPMLAWLKKEIEVNRKEIELNKALGLPQFEAGYMSEAVVGQQFQGIMVGVSIPLWENKNKVKFAKANTIALESLIVDNKLQFYNHLKVLHTKAVGLQQNTTVYRAGLNSYNNSELLKKALDKGEISLIDYFVEFSFYYESVNRLLELERDLNKTFAELSQYF